MTELWYIWILLAVIFIYRLLRPRIKGFMGEKTVAAVLSLLPRSRYKVINNVVLDTGDRTSQIDHVVVSDFGVFVIETKNYKGWILGHESSQYWTQVIYKRKEKLYNPIRQNNGHIMALKHHLTAFPGIRYIPIVVFSNSATIKVKSTSAVINTSRLLRVIRQYTEEVLTEYEKNAIFEKINVVNISTSYSRKQHIRSIKRRKQELDRKIQQNECPRCGGALVTREGKFGKFKGCSNFPGCTFTLGVS